MKKVSSLSCYQSFFPYRHSKLRRQSCEKFDPTLVARFAIPPLYFFLYKSQDSDHSSSKKHLISTNDKTAEHPNPVENKTGPVRKRRT